MLERRWHSIVRCFAYKGLIQNYIWLHYSYKDAVDAETKTGTSRYSLNFERDSDVESTTWYYTCFDMMSHVSGTRPDDTNIRLKQAWIARSVWDMDIFVDALYIGSRPTMTDYTDVNLLRRAAAMPNGAIIDTATVASGATDQYNVTLVPFDCGDQFPLFELENSQLTSGRPEYPRTAAGYQLSNSRSGSMSVSRISHASPPVMGTIDVEFKGNNKTDLNISLTDSLFGKELESLVGIGDLSVRKTGNCANFDMAVTFMSLPGDQPEMIVSSEGLTGIDAQGSIVTDTDGGLFYTPLTGDMVSTVHDTPQVRLFINDVPTKCSGDCSFQWSSGVTPTVASVSPTSGAMALGTSVVIMGTGFDPEQANNTVTIGGVDCSITDATTSSITCDVGNGPVGAHKVMVTVMGKGYAEHSGGEVTFAYDADISSIDPTTGSQGGGITLTVKGYGFTDAAMVTVGSRSCDVIEVSLAAITCTLPPSSSAGTVDVVVMQDSMNYSYSGFNYDAGLTPSVTNIEPSSVSVGGGTITVSGSNFGSSGTASVGDVNGDIVSYADNEIIFEVSGLESGTQDIRVGGANGFGLSGSSVPTINVDLSVTNVYPLSGSLQGGTRLTVTGTGFGNSSSLVDVDVGDVSCNVESVTDTEIVCLIDDTGKVHEVTNLGIHRAYGIYYAFDKPQLTIERGDFVQWSWQTPNFVNDINHAIYEVESLSSTVPLEGGFSSGPPSRNGNFRYQFTQLGTFYVWSGYVDVYGIKNYAGQIEVRDKVSSLAEVRVRVSGIEALYNVGGSSDPVDSSSCQSVTSAKMGCSEVLPSGGDSRKFNFAFWSCATPVIDMVDQNNGTAKTDITITGEGFSTAACQNEVMFSDYGWTVSSASEASVTCTMDKSYEPTLGVYHPVSMRVGNRGYALVNIMSPEAQSFGVLPNIENISPTFGSLAGEARLTITGFGYGGGLSVTVGNFPCNVVNSSYTEIICETPSSVTSSEVDVVVYVMVNGAPQMAACETSNSQCKYTYSSSFTPAISAIDTPTMSGATTFTITGRNLGTDKMALEVYIGTEMASVISSDGAYLVAGIQNVPAGTNDVIVRHNEYGRADGSVTVTGSAVISSVVPSSGSIYGETEITITGNGFVEGDTSVTVDSNPCSVTSITLSEVICQTPSGSSGTVDLVVTSNSVTYPTESFDYSTGSTPEISSIDPTSGLSGVTLTISGTNLAGSSVEVLLDDVPCTNISGSSSEIQCTVGAHATGLVPVYVYVSELGASNVDKEFEYTLALTNINPNTGGTAGGQTVTLTGQGFSEDMSASICGQPCTRKTTSTDFECRTPANSAQTCDVVVSVNGLSKTLSSAYTYDAALTPTITGVTPRRGGTGGGTTLTVTGSGFGTIKADVSVMIDGAACTVSQVTNIELECETGPHSGSVTAKVEVEVSGNGIAQESSAGDSDFSYIDVWSSSYTWGGESPPVEGDFVIIPAGQTLLLDTDTPVLSFLLIQGGQLIFDEKDIELQANIIMITDGGLLQVGTQDEPFEHKAIITLHGHHRSRELPIYGTKVLAVRNGSLELHGQEVPLTWTRLASTATVGSLTLELVDPVEWNVDDEIVIAATGHHHTQSENEKKTIKQISLDKRTLTLDSPLEASHLGVEETFDGTLVEMRGEVGLLTHNVVVRGNRDPQWTEFIEACPKGFNTGEFAVQTCFLGRFGDEIGSSQFGGMILVHAPEKDTYAAEARLSYIEVTFAGQAFRLGRYPVHFHLNGDMSTSYVRGLSIHETFNRAVNVHGTHNTMVEKTVIYNVMGGAMFLEDGIETGNTFQYNLAVFVRESSSLLNDDITPASFWVTNPNNTIQHNAAAGGSHFGFWYRMHSKPDGPSFTPDVCPDKVPLGVFYNNSAHSFGWFGLWMFTNYFPTKDGACSGSEVEPAVFRGLFAWNNEKGVEFVNMGALQVDDFVLVQNKLSGYEGKKVLNIPLYTDESPMVMNSLIVGTTTVAPDSTQGCTNGGIVLPFGAGFRVKNVRFVNFATDCAAIATARITGTCSLYCGGYNYHFEGISFINSPNKNSYAWDWESILIDIDGTLTGKPDNEWKVVPTTGSLPHDCEDAPGFDVGVPASLCPPQYKFHRYAFNNIIPKSIEGKDLIIMNQYGNSSVPFAKKRLSHKPGWMCALVSGETYKFEFENAEHMTNISYTGAFYNFDASDYLIVRIPVDKFPDRLSIDGGNTYINATLDGLDPSNGTYGDWDWDNSNSEIKFLVHGTLRSKRSMPVYGVDRALTFTAFKCYYKDCIPPPDPDTVPPLPERPAVYDYWNDESLWNMSSDGYIVNLGGSSGVPEEYADVRIEFDTWVVVNTSINVLGNLVLEGTLEFANYPGAMYELNATNIIIMGGRLIIGWPDDPFLGLADIVLRGDHSSPNFVAQGSGPTIGNKALGVFGGLDLHGRDVGVTWTKLGAIASAGDTEIILAENVSWVAGDEIVIGPSHYDPWETETFMITSVSGDGMTLTLNGSLRFDHLVYWETFPNGQSVDVAAPVGLLTRNIRIIGEDYPKLYEQSYGARVLVGLYATASQTYTGYARLSNVEFVHTGQEGYTESYDARFSLAYIAVGTVSKVKPSSVTKCSFHKGFNSAIGAFGIGSLNITDNVIHHVVGNEVTFAHFGASACNGDYAIATNAKNDDGQHPVRVEQITMFDVDPDYKVVYHRPNIRKINSADCVDMDCDAFKKALLKDIDGSFLGHIGAVIPQSEYEWGTNPSRGLGDYRIPKEMVTEMDGTRIPYEEMMPNKGVIRNSNCTYRAGWQAYECGDDLNYEMLIIESMDPDTETRRLSPVAILGDGYIDLINGPQDHGWCSGYTCRKRVSTFMALVATEKEYLMHFTSTTPFHMKYHLLNTDTEAIKLTVWYSRPNRLDVYVDGSFVMATNARINHLGFYVLEMPIADEYDPKLADVTGTNKIDHERGEHTIIIKGSTPVEVITQEVIIVSFGLPAMTVEDFYGANIVENLAAFLNIPLTKVRVVNIVSENGGSRRRKRNSGGTTVEIEIGDEPASGINDTVSDSLDNSALQDLASEIVNECQVGDLQSSLNVTGNCESVEVPATSASADLIVYNTPQPDRLVFTVGAVPKYENVPLEVQPKIQVLDTQNVVVTELGTLEHPWELEVSIRPGTGHPDAVLSGTLLVNASDGWFNFTDLAISHMGTGYILDFNVTYPSAAANFTLSTSPFDVAGRPIRAHVVTKTSGDIVRNAGFSVGIDLRDRQTGDIISNIGWRNHIWYADVEILGNPQYGGLTGVLTTMFDQITGRALFPNLQITGYGFFYIQFCVYSDPPGFNFTLNEKMHIMNPAHVGMVPEEEYEIEVKFNVDYDKILPSEDKENEFEQMILSEYANVWPDVRMKSGGIRRGSITITFVIDGSLSDVNATAYSLCESISNSTSYTFDGYTLTLDTYMTIDNQTFYGVECGTMESSSSSDDGLSPAIIAIIVVISILIIVIVAAVVFWRCYIVKKSKTKELCQDPSPASSQFMGHDNKLIEEKFFNDNIFDSKKVHSSSTAELRAEPVPPVPPISTLQIGYHKGKQFRPPMNIMNLGLSSGEPQKIEKKEPSGLSISTLSVHARSPTPPRNRVAPDPVMDNEHLASNLSKNLLLARSPSPNLLYPRDESPASAHGGSRTHSPFEYDDGDNSPMPPAEDLYHGKYITEIMPRSVTPHLPPPGPITVRESAQPARKPWNQEFIYTEPN